MRGEAAWHRDNLLAIYHAALAAVEGRRRVATFLRAHPLSGPLYVIAIGKAAAAMVRGVLDVLEPEVQRLLVITRHGYGQDIRAAHPGLVLVEAGHPVPDARSLDAGRLLLEMIDGAPANAGFLFLISGGASSLLEVPRPGITLSDLQRVNRWLLAAGLPIQEMNHIRKALSAVKGGHLLSRLAGRRVWNLLISDVPGDDPAVIGSGLLIASGDRLPTSEAVPPWLGVLLVRAGRSRQEASLSRGAEVETHIIAANRDARLAAAEQGRRLGYAVHLHDDFIAGDVMVAAADLSEQQARGSAGLHVWGGEVTVRLPPRPGEGGRCQHLALLMAQKLQYMPRTLFLAGATDGSDGTAARAGALVDSGTIGRGHEAGLDAADCLQHTDAGRFLAASGDLIATGVTGSNVMDLLLGLGW
ncbi:MAG: glycerate kinase [Gammaproteobacteria bacterium]